MKNFLILFIVLFLNVTLNNAQENGKPIHLSLLLEKQFHIKEAFINQDKYMFGINVEIFLKDNLSINYAFSAGYFGNKWQFHLPGGLVSGLALEKSIFNAILPSYSDDDEYSDDSDEGTVDGNLIQLLAIPAIGFLMIIPEGINYYYRVNGYISYAVYFNPFGVQFSGGKAYVSSGMGLKLEYPFSDRFLFKPQIGFKELWGKGSPKAILDLGLNFSIRFK